MSKKLLFTLFAIAVVSMLWVPGLWAQTGSTSALTGTVTDPTGAVVPNVTVTVTSTGTNRSRTVTTGADGVYSIPLLEPGPYKVRFAAQGFKGAEVGSVTLNVTETVALDRALEVGSQTDQVTVEASVARVLKIITTSSARSIFPSHQ